MKTIEDQNRARQAGFDAARVWLDNKMRGGYPEDARKYWERLNLEYSFDAGFAQMEREYLFTK